VQTAGGFWRWYGLPVVVSIATFSALNFIWNYPVLADYASALVRYTVAIYLVGGSGLALAFLLRAVANAILDHHMHCDGWTDEEATALLTQRAFQSEGEAVAKIVRAKQSSCQLSTYFVGRTAFYRLRQQVEREQGDAFDLGRFHEAVLDNGTLPVKYLPELVRDRLGKPR
jgi:hypothetical protein